MPRDFSPRSAARNDRRIYLDYAATTPVDPAVLRAMRPYFSEKFGNAGSLHSFGQEAIAAVDRARETVAKAVDMDFRGVIFTGSATEANNLALRGIVKKAESGERRAEKRPRIIVSSIEHESVLETARDLEKEGVEVVYLPVSKRGIVDLKKLKGNLTENTTLVSVMYVNNEIGTIQPIKEIAEIIKEFRGTSSLSALRSPLFHTDASQAFQYFDCNMEALGVDLMTLSSHKIYGQKGTAALCFGNRVSGIGYRGEEKIKLNKIISGGGQEFGLRSGTENVPAIVGFAKAVEVMLPMQKEEFERVSTLREYFWRGIKKIYPKAEMNGVDNPSLTLPSERGGNRLSFSAPHILNIYFPGFEAQDILTRLDLAGVAASSGSACRSRAMAGSYVIEALGFSKARAKSSIRFSFGRQTTKGELDGVLKILKSILKFP
jgi:cysteine desulfurase